MSSSGWLDDIWTLGQSAADCGLLFFLLCLLPRWPTVSKSTRIFVLKRWNGTLSRFTFVYDTRRTVVCLFIYHYVLPSRYISNTVEYKEDKSTRLTALCVVWGALKTAALLARRDLPVPLTPQLPVKWKWKKTTTTADFWRARASCLRARARGKSPRRSKVMTWAASDRSIDQLADIDWG